MAKELVTFGEAMIRFAPLTPQDEDTASINPSAAAQYLRTVGGDELNVAVAMSRLGVKSQWISVLPSGPMGNIVKDSAITAGVDMSHVVYREHAELGTFYVFPKERRVYYQRANSAWAKQERDLFDWYSLLKRQNIWLHMTGISPLTGSNPKYNWKRAIETAYELGVPVSMDLNHRKLLGPLNALWKITTPFLSKMKILILSLDSLRGIGQLEGFQLPAENTPEDDQSWITLMTNIQRKYGGARVACCFKTRDSTGLQRRWSVIVDSQVTISTYDYPVFHRPKDELGGGSAWAAGYLDMMFDKGEDITHLVSAARRADLLAALCQETPGDHSLVTRSQLTEAEATFVGKPAQIGTCEVVSVKTVVQGQESQLKDVLKRIEDVRVLAILRAKNSEVAIQRGIELVEELGCKAIEVTMDSENALTIVKELVKRIPKEKCLIGVGTVMDLSQVEDIIQAGATFAVSPINPEGFIKAFHERGVLAIPSAFTPNELFKTAQQGAMLMKLFPAQLWTPSTLKDVLSIGSLGLLHIMPTGGLTPELAAAWLQAGAKAVGMGSKLVGRDVRVSAKDQSDLAVAKLEWTSEGKSEAKKCFDMIASIKL